MITDSDDELYRRYRAGNRQAFDILYQRFRQPLYNYVRKNINADRVDELYQDIWLKVVASKNYKNSGRFRQWLFTCAHHLIVDEYRKNARASYVPFDDLSQDSSSPNTLNSNKLASNNLVSDEPISDANVQKKINNALEELPSEQRQAFHLRHELGCSIADIAAIQGCPTESAKSRLRYAYGKLKTQLKDYQP